MSSASRPSGVSPCGAPASMTASQSAGASFGMAEELVAELARVAGARDDQRQALRAADPRRSRSGTSSSSANGVCVGGVQIDPRSRISRLVGPWTATLCSSSVDSLTQTRRPSRSACSRSQTPSYSAPPTKRKLSGAMPEHGAVVDHPARLVAHRRVDDLAVGEPADVARHRRLQQRLGVGAEDLELPQRREIHHRRLLAAGPVLVDRAEVVVRGRQPVAVVLGEAARQRARCAAWKPVSFVSFGSASGVTRCAIAARSAPSAG